jgi:hypothetical protein
LRNKHKQCSNVLIMILSATCQKIKRLLQHSEAKFQTTQAVLFLFRSSLTDDYFQSKRSRKLCFAALLRKQLNYKHIIFGYSKGPTHLMMESEEHFGDQMLYWQILDYYKFFLHLLPLIEFASFFLFWCSLYSCSKEFFASPVTLS